MAGCITFALLMCGVVLSVSAQNKIPLLNFRDQVTEWRVTDKKNNLYAQFKSSMTLTIADNGKLKITEPTFSGDAGMKKIVSDGILALSDSGMLNLFKETGIKSAKLFLEQTGSQFDARIEAAAPTSDKAKKLHTSLKMLVEMGAILEGDDPSVVNFLKMVSVDNQNENVIIKASVPNSFVEEEVQKQIKIHEEAKTKAKSK